jgi:arginyl-tRNA synthetase
MIIAKPLGKAPIEIAKIIKAELEKIAYVESVTIAGPGFINLNLKIDIWHQILSSILEQGIEFGDNNMGNGEAINIEFVSTNPTGPMHIGHSRGGIYGDSLANLMTKSGYKVTKEFYINDAGAQIDTLGKSVYLRYLKDLSIVANILPVIETQLLDWRKEYKQIREEIASIKGQLK